MLSRWYMGINTGTSMDAIDVAVFDFSHKLPLYLGGYSHLLEGPLRHDLLALVDNPNVTYVEVMCAQARLSREIQQAVRFCIAKYGWDKSQFKAIGLHGQTIHHCPDHAVPYSLQLNDGHGLAKALGVPVVTDFRQSDIALGGMGAPLMPLFQRYLMESYDLRKSVFLNLGGIACLSEVSLGDEAVSLAYDVGPANALMDAWVYKHLGQSYDDQGRWAASGLVCEPLLHRLLEDDYFTIQPPKSTGRETFSLAWLEQKLSGLHLKAEDVQATLLAFTVQILSQAIVSLSSQIDCVWLHGKGVANTYCIEKLQASLPQCELRRMDELGVSTDWIETALFAWLAYAHQHRLALDTGFATKAKKPGVLGASYI